MIKQRNTNIELLRIVLMFGICVLHAYSHTGDPLPWLTNGLRWLVDCFVFITGWYGIAFRPSKLLRLLVTAFVSSGLAVALGFAINVWPGAHNNPMVAAYRVVTGHWFLTAYVALMLVSPLLNALADEIVRTKNFAFAIPFFLALLWSWGSELYGIGKILPLTPGLGSYTALSLAGVYFVARLAHDLGMEWSTNSMRLCAGGIVA